MGTVIPGPDAPPWGIGLPPPRTRLARARASAITALMDVAARGVRRRVNEFRAVHDLPAIERSVSAFAAESSLYLVAGLPELDYNRRDLPPSVHYVGACVWHPPTPPDASASLDAIPSDLPWIHATEGTSHYQKPFLLKAAAQGLGGQPMHVILTTGAKRDPEALGLAPLPSNVHLAQWVSHTELLPRCAVVVTTGGANTIVSSLQAGTPLVVVPTTWDKPDNARRVVEAGVGVRLSARKCTPERLREAIEHVLAEPAYRANAQRIAAAFREAPGPRVAADLLEGLVARDHGSVGARAL
jgi:MGT family glycosyltransferase